MKPGDYSYCEQCKDLNYICVVALEYEKIEGVSWTAKIIKKLALRENNFIDPSAHCEVYTAMLKAFAPEEYLDI